MCCRVSQNINSPTYSREAEIWKITSLALAITSIACIAIGSGLFGLGLSKRVMSIGVGVLPYLAGWFLFALAVGTLAASAFAALAYAVQTKRSQV